MTPDNRTPEEKIEHNLTNHTPSAKGITAIENLRRAAKNFSYAVAAESKQSREQSLALTHIEEALFWANAAVARYDEGTTRAAN